MQNAHSLENEHRTVAERRKTAPNHCRTQQDDPKSLQNAAKRPQIVAERNKTTPKSLQNTAERHQIVAEHSKRTQNRCRTQQNDPKSLQNAATRPQIVAGRSKTTPNRCRAHQNDTKPFQNAAKRPQINAERSFSRELAHTLENERSAMIWREFVAFCFNSGPNCWLLRCFYANCSLRHRFKTGKQTENIGPV